MDRTLLDKLESNVNSLKGELDNYYLNGLTPEVQALAARICELAGGHDPEDAQKTILAMRKSLEERRKLNGELQEVNTLLRRRNNVLAAEIEAMKRKLAAAEALAMELEFTNRVLSRFSVLAYNPEIQDHIPFGLADEVKDWVKRSRAETALRQYREASDG